MAPTHAPKAPGTCAEGARHVRRRRPAHAPKALGTCAEGARHMSRRRPAHGIFRISQVLHVGSHDLVSSRTRSSSRGCSSHAHRPDAALEGRRLSSASTCMRSIASRRCLLEHGSRLAPEPSCTAKAVYKSKRGCHHVPRRRHINLTVAAATCREGGI